MEQYLIDITSNDNTSYRLVDNTRYVVNNKTEPVWHHDSTRRLDADCVIHCEYPQTLPACISDYTRLIASNRIKSARSIAT